MDSKSHAQLKELSLENHEHDKSPQYKRPSVYDAVAGRVSASGFISKPASICRTRDTSSSSRLVLPPEHVLFRSKKAPTRFAEYDIYFANERHDVSHLPDSDLLKALHAYAADFYFKTTSNKGITDWKSLDETALIALGILTEELVKEMIGETGDLALTEGESLIVEQEKQVEIRTTRNPGPPKKRQKTKSVDSA